MRRRLVTSSAWVSSLTRLYAQAGGQIYDAGVLSGANFKVDVEVESHKESASEPRSALSKESGSVAQSALSSPLPQAELLSSQMESGSVPRLALSKESGSVLRPALSSSCMGSKSESAY
ncbi:hypothetical protein PR001_g12720 [Phytophthora rubi]|uniref:Uncharacterized protein n=1 Tax=Phytophthora rubi TaxID=129364 RepID=A0A6A3H6U6_9STRA|nr:hypothetical protein PR002_g28745 [Phytophthora rubi]KAE9024266.1 hypothetical protein PR001_g12720 [Phytophthora rubi]